MDQRPRGAHRTGVTPVAIDLGNEPPLSVDGESSAGVDRHRVSVQWFSGTILAGLCGAALMSGAVFAALDGEAHFASSPERFEMAARGGSHAEKSGPRKGDRLPAAGETTVARQVFRDTRMVKIGDREVPRVRSFMRISANLALSTTELSAGIPKFDAQKMLAESSGAAASNTQADAAPDAEVSFVTRDLSSVLPRAKIAVMVSLDDVIARVRDAGNWPGAGGAPAAGTYTVASISPVPAGAGRLSYAAEATADPYAGFEARVVPENITLLGKTSTQSSTNANERVLVAKKGDTLVSVVREFNSPPEEVKALMTALGLRSRDGALKEGQKVRILLSPVMGSQRMQPVRVILSNDNGIEAAAALSDMGKYVAIDIQSADTPVANADDDDDDDGSGVRLYQSIYETALRNQVPRTVIDELIKVYSYDVDFQRKAQPGDSLEVLFAGEEEGVTNDKSDVLFASLTVGGETKKFYRYQSTDDGVVDYYDETGKSAKKFLVRKPVGPGIMRSGFGSRRHPILGYTKMHTGVDWAAPMGTPIYASGNGVVEKAEWEGGYGKFVLLQHPNGYETAYGHMTAFARGIEPGKRVRQGQVIGFVGSTGLSTGAHVHYEIRVNGRFIDPMRIKLPRGRILEGVVLATFERERDRLDGMMTQGPSRVANVTAR